VDLSRPISRRLVLGAGGLSLVAACAPQRTLTEDGTVDLLTLLRGRPEHSRFVGALEAAGLTGRVGRPNGAVTLFVPTNESFAGLGAELIRLFDAPPSSPTAEQRAAAARIVNANAAFGLLRLDDLEARRGEIVTWDRGRIRVARTGPRTGTIQREGASGRAPVMITRGDILASDGVYHVTNAPVLPA
jgi:hypothetical protein